MAYQALTYPDAGTMEKIRRRWNEYGIKLKK